MEAKKSKLYMFYYFCILKDSDYFFTSLIDGEMIYYTDRKKFLLNDTLYNIEKDKDYDIIYTCRNLFGNYISPVHSIKTFNIEYDKYLEILKDRVIKSVLEKYVGRNYEKIIDKFKDFFEKKKPLLQKIFRKVFINIIPVYIEDEDKFYFYLKSSGNKDYLENILYPEILDIIIVEGSEIVNLLTKLCKQNTKIKMKVKKYLETNKVLRINYTAVEKNFSLLEPEKRKSAFSICEILAMKPILEVYKISKEKLSKTLDLFYEKKIKRKFKIEKKVFKSKIMNIIKHYYVYKIKFEEIESWEKKEFSIKLSKNIKIQFKFQRNKINLEVKEE